MLSTLCRAWGEVNADVYVGERDKRRGQDKPGGASPPRQAIRAVYVSIIRRIHVAGRGFFHRAA